MELAIRTTKAGTLKQQGKREVKRFWVETRHQRYVPSMDDLVVGIVMECHGETYSVDVGGPQAALLPILGFEGADAKEQADAFAWRRGVRQGVCRGQRH